MNFKLTALLLATLQAVLADPPAPSQCQNNEVFSMCGNLCEDTCSNNCDPPIFQSFMSLNPSNPDCVAGCYCQSGYIRNDDGACVPNVPGVCSGDRCGVISRNAVYQRCVAGFGLACFQRTIAIKPSGYMGRCVCKEGYSMNSQKRCVRTDSRGCRRENDLQLDILFMQTTYDC